MNDAFTMLRSLIPATQKEKLTKLKTLRLTTSYISHLSRHMLLGKKDIKNDIHVILIDEHFSGNRVEKM